MEVSEARRQELRAYGVVIVPFESGESAKAVEKCIPIIVQGIKSLSSVLGGSIEFQHRTAGVKIELKKIRYGGFAQAHRLTLNPEGLTAWTVVHEMAHAWDAATGWRNSRELQQAMGAGYQNVCCRILRLFHPEDPRNWYLPGNGPPSCGIDRYFNAREDFAEAVAAMVFPEEAKSRAGERGWPYNDPSRGYVYADFHATPRGKFMGELMQAGSPGEHPPVG